MNLYEILGIKKTATPKKIKEAYRQQSKIHHPDTGGDAQKFHLISKAYKILIDEAKKKRYDAGENVDQILESSINQEKNAQNILMRMFCEIVVQIDPETNDIVELMRKNLNNLLKQLENNLNIQMVRKKRFEETIKRIKSKENNIFIDVAQAQIDEVERIIKKIEIERKDFEVAIKFLENFNYDFDLRPQFATTNTYYTSTGSWA